MRSRFPTILFAALLTTSAATPAVWAQGLKTVDDLETDSQVISNAPAGTSPLVVASTTNVVNLNADLLDGEHASFFATAAELLAAMDALDNPDPPCFDTAHRFVDCGNGTVTDTQTGLIWLKDADCVRSNYKGTNEQAAALADGSCGLTDGSKPGDWRLPTPAEYESILDPTCPTKPEIVGNGTPAVGCYADNPWAVDVIDNHYWSVASSESNHEKAWAASLFSGTTHTVFDKTINNWAWPVRGGQ